MKSIISGISAVFLALNLNAQVLPKNSPEGSATQTIGSSKIEINYHRPSVKGRKIFGELLPFDVIWRMGANASTKFTTSDTLKFGSNTLAPGTYALFAIPHADNSFTVIFNTNPNQRGTANYEEVKDVFRLKVNAQTNSFIETLYLGFDNIKYDSADFIMLWGETKLVIPFSVNTNQVSIANINQAIAKGQNLLSVYEAAGNFYFKSLKNSKEALEFANKSIKIKPTNRNLFLKAQIMAQKGDLKQAIELGEQALELSKKTNSKGYTNYITRTVKGWKER